MTIIYNRFPPNLGLSFQDTVMKVGLVGQKAYDFKSLYWNIATFIASSYAIIAIYELVGSILSVLGLGTDTSF